MGKAPCVLCWYQRIAMFPLALILAIGLLRAEPHAIRYSLPLAIVGWMLATYHSLLFWGVITEAPVPCGAGASCAASDLQLAGVIPIPLLSWLAFTGIAVLLWSARERKP